MQNHFYHRPLLRSLIPPSYLHIQLTFRQACSMLNDCGPLRMWGTDGRELCYYRNAPATRNLLPMRGCHFSYELNFKIHLYSYITHSRYSKQEGSNTSIVDTRHPSLLNTWFDYWPFNSILTRVEITLQQDRGRVVWHEGMEQEHGSETSRPFRKLWPTDDRPGHSEVTLPISPLKASLLPRNCILQ